MALGLAWIDSGQTGSSTAVAMASLLAKSGCVATSGVRSVCPFGRGQLKRQVSDEPAKDPQRVSNENRLKMAADWHRKAARAHNGKLIVKCVRPFCFARCLRFGGGGGGVKEHLKD